MAHIKTGKLVKDVALYSGGTGSLLRDEAESLLDSDVRELMLQLLAEGESIAKQLKVLKKISDIAITRKFEENDCKRIISLLLEGIYLCSEKSTPKSAALGIVESLCKNEGSYLQYAVEKLQNFLERADVKLGIRLVSTILESNYIKQFLLQSFCSVLDFYRTAISKVYEQLKEPSGAVVKADLHADLHLGMCCFVKVLQLQTEVPEDEDLIKALISILSLEDVPLDLTNSSARALIAFLHSAGFPVKTILDSVRSGEKSHDEKQSFEKLKSASSNVKLSLCSGLLSALSPEELVDETFLGEKMFSLILKWSEGLQETSLAIQSCRTVELWSQICSGNVGCLATNLRFRDEWETSIRESLLEYLLSAMEHQVDVVRYSAKTSFSNFIIIFSRIEIDSEKAQQHLMGKILRLDPHKRSKYMAITAIAAQWGAEKLISASPELPTDLLSAAADPSLSNHVKDAYKALMLQAASSNEDWVTRWMEPLLQRLADHPESFVFAELLEQLVKAKPGAAGLVHHWLASGSLTAPRLRVFLTCLVACKRLGIISKTSGGSNLNMWRNAIEVDTLKIALYHQEGRIRLLAFTLIIEGPKSSELMEPVDLQLLQGAIENTMTNQNPAFRNQLAGLFKKLLVRIKEGLQKKPTNQNAEILENYKAFLQWTIDLSLKSLEDFSSFPRRCLALSFLTSLKEILGFQNQKHFQIPHAAAQTLIGALNDSYETNKEAALVLLTEEPILSYSYRDVNSVKTILDWSISHCQSVRPPTNATAAYLFRWLAKLPVLQEILEASHSDPTIVSEDWRNVYQLLCSLVDILELHIEMANQNLLRAAVETPIHGVLLAIRLLLNDHQKRINAAEEPWSVLIHKLIELCFRACSVVGPVVNNSSPEGHLPMDTEPSNFENLGGEDCGSTNESPRSVSAQLLLVCSWRTVKEASLFLGQLCSMPSFGDVDLIKSIVQHFSRLLMETKHRGAFEQAYTGFTKVCTRLWSSTVKDLFEEPRLLLDKLINVVRNPELETKLCATRRSAGIPFLIQAILAPEVESGSEVLFRQTVGSLLALVEDFGKTEQLETRIHVLNILRAVYRDSRLGEAVGPFVARGLILAVRGFEAPTWAERNSSTLLFTALMNRVFGVPRSKEDVSRKNSMTGRVFFRLYPSLYPFLLDRLNGAVMEINHQGLLNLHPALYPILMILSRLHPPASEASDSTFQLAPFVPLVRRCAGVPVLKTRQLAAQALTPLIAKENFNNVLNEVLESLNMKKIATNQLHGNILQLQGLLKELFHWNQQDRHRIILVGPSILEQTSYIIHNPCCTIRRSYIELLEILYKLQIVDLELLKDLSSICLTHLRGKDFKNPDFPLYCQAAARFVCWSRAADEILELLLEHPLYEVRAEALQYLWKNSRIFNQQLLWKMLLIEQDPGCLSLILRLLIPRQLDPGSAEKILEILEENRNEEAKAAALETIAALISHFTGVEEQSFVLEKLLIKWSFHLLEISGSSESVALKTAAANALHKNPPLINKLKGRSYYSVWMSLFHLLNEDDDKIRHLTEDTIQQLGKDSRNQTSFLVAMETALELFCTSPMALEKPGESLAFLVLLLFQNNFEEKSSEENSSTAFDKGNSNSSFEPLIFSQTVAKFLQKFCAFPNIFWQILSCEFLDFVQNSTFCQLGATQPISLENFCRKLLDSRISRLESKALSTFGPNEDFLEFQQCFILCTTLEKSSELFQETLDKLRIFYGKLPAFCRTYSVQQLFEY